MTSEFDSANVIMREVTTGTDFENVDVPGKYTLFFVEIAYQTSF